MVSWVGLLAGCVIFGVMIVAALVLPRTASPVALVVGFVGMFTSVTSFGSIASRYGSSGAIGGSMVVLIAGITAGYAVAAATLPYLKASPRAHVGSVSGEGSRGVVLVGCCEPERYDPRVVARRQALLEESAQIVVPMTALPFVYFAEKARYRALGGRLAGESTARQLADRVTSAPDAADWKVALAWCHTPDSLPRAVASLASAGVDTIALIPLGMPESAPLDELQKALADASHEEGAPTVTPAPTVWSDRLLPERMAERIIAATAGARTENVGVLLVSEGSPEAWDKRYSGASEADTYFNQRVKVLLAETGMPERHIRTAYLEWVAPDVTEALRHLVALGCTRVVVAPTTVALPTLETSLDLGHAIALARAPEDVLVVALHPWGDDEVFADALRRSGKAALESSAGGPEG